MKNPIMEKILLNVSLAAMVTPFSTPYLRTFWLS